jgi:hypothetical protein
MQSVSAKEFVMFRKTTVVLAIALVLGGSALSSNAFARGGGDDGYNGIGEGGFRRNHFPGARRDDSYRGYDGRVSGLRGGFPGDQRGDMWHHWGAYYGPMISIP